MSLANLSQIHDRECEQRRRSLLYLLALFGAIVVVISAFVVVLR